MEKLRQHLTNNQDLLKHSTADIVLTVSGEKFNAVIDHVKKVSQSGQTVCQRVEKTYADQGQPFPQDVLDTREALDRYMRIVHDKMMVVVDCWNGVQKKVDGIKVRFYTSLFCCTSIYCSVKCMQRGFFFFFRKCVIWSKASNTWLTGFWDRARRC